MESLCSPGQGSSCPRCGHPTGEGEAARASSTAGNDLGIVWVLIGMQEILRTHSGCEPALQYWGLDQHRVRLGEMTSGNDCSIPVGVEAWLHSLDQSSQCPQQLPAAAACDPEPGLGTRTLPGAASSCRDSLSTASALPKV